MNTLVIFLKTVVFYFLILLIYKFLNKKTIKDFTVIDFVISIIICNLIAIAILSSNISFWHSLLAIFLIIVLQVIMLYKNLKDNKIDNFSNKNASFLIKNGKIVFEEVLKQNYDLDNLIKKLKEQKYKSIDEVQYAILEKNGNLSILEKVNEKNDSFPLPLIIEGEIKESSLQYLNKDKLWLLDNIDTEIDNIFYAFYKDKSIYIIKNNELV